MPSKKKKQKHELESRNISPLAPETETYRQTENTRKPACEQLHHHQVGGDGEAVQTLSGSQLAHHLKIIGDELEGRNRSEGELTHHQPSADDEPDPKIKTTMPQKPNHQSEPNRGDQPNNKLSGNRSSKIKEKQNQILEALRRSRVMDDERPQIP